MPGPVTQRILVHHLWDGSPAAPAEHVTLELAANPPASTWTLLIDAPYHDDPPPPNPPAHTPGLWNFEVVELFLFGADGRYLELEFGPRGHHLALELHGIRNIVRTVPDLQFRSDIERDRWRGRADIDLALLPPGIARWNAHAIHGLGPARRYLSAHPAGGERPDFHRPDVSAPLDPALLRALQPATR